MRNLMIATALLAVLGGSAVAPAATRTESQDYVGTYDWLSPRACETMVADFRYGMACFDVKGKDQAFDLHVQDVISSPTGIFWLLADANGDCASGEGDVGDACGSAGFGCSDVNSIGITPGSAQLLVWVLGPSAAPVACAVANGDVATSATTGTITATFHR